MAQVSIPTLPPVASGPISLQQLYSLEEDLSGRLVQVEAMCGLGRSMVADGQQLGGAEATVLRRRVRAAQGALQALLLLLPEDPDGGGGQRQTDRDPGASGPLGEEALGAETDPQTPAATTTVGPAVQTPAAAAKVESAAQTPAATTAVEVAAQTPAVEEGAVTTVETAAQTPAVEDGAAVTMVEVAAQTPAVTQEDEAASATVESDQQTPAEAATGPAAEAEAAWLSDIARLLRDHSPPLYHPFCEEQLYLLLENDPKATPSKFFPLWDCILKHHPPDDITREDFEEWVGGLCHPDFEERWRHAFPVYIQAELPGFQDNLPLLLTCPLPPPLKQQVLDAVALHPMEDFIQGLVAENELDEAALQATQAHGEAVLLVRRMSEYLRGYPKKEGDPDCHRQRDASWDMIHLEDNNFAVGKEIGVPRPKPNVS